MRAHTGDAETMKYQSIAGRKRGVSSSEDESERSSPQVIEPRETEMLKSNSKSFLWQSRPTNEQVSPVRKKVKQRETKKHSVQHKKSRQSTDERSSVGKAKGVSKSSVLDLENDSQAEVIEATLGSAKDEAFRDTVQSRTARTAAAPKTKDSTQVVVKVPQILSQGPRPRSVLSRRYDASKQIGLNTDVETADEITEEEQSGESEYTNDEMDASLAEEQTTTANVSSDCDDPLALQRNDLTEPTVQGKRRLGVDTKRSTEVQWESSHFIRLLPERWATTLVPNSVRLKPTATLDVPAPPSGYRRPVVMRHVGFLTPAHKNPKPKKGTKQLKGVVIQEEERGEAVYLKMVGNKGGYSWVNGRNHKHVAKDTVELQPSLQATGALSSLIEDMVRQWKEEEDAEKADHRRRWINWRKSRREAEYRRVRFYIENGHTNLFNPNSLAQGKIGEIPLEGLRRWVEIENARDDQGLFPIEYAGLPVSSYDLTEADEQVMQRVLEVVGTKLSRTSRTDLKTMSTLVVAQRRQDKIEEWERGGRKGREPYNYSDLSGVEREAAEQHEEHELERQLQTQIASWAKKAAKRKPGRPPKKTKKVLQKTGHTSPDEENSSENGSEDSVQEISPDDQDTAQGWRDFLAIAPSIDTDNAVLSSSARIFGENQPRSNGTTMATPSNTNMTMAKPRLRDVPSVPNHGGNHQQSFAQAAFNRRYPYGYDREQTSSEGLLCALHAVVISLYELNAASLEHNLPVPTVQDLYNELQRAEHRQALSNAGLLGIVNNFHVDMVALALRSWASRRFGQNICLGYFGDGLDPVLCSYEKGDKVVFIWNDQAAPLDSTTEVSHFEGIVPRGASAMMMP